jgi:hypothetical protein
LPNWKSCTLQPGQFPGRFENSSDRCPAIIAAAKRLFEKELTDQPDGGYLTSLGRDAAEQCKPC